MSLEDRREREREVERLVRSRSARTHTLSLGPKINSSCSLHFLPDVKQPFVRSCQASQERPRGVPTPWTATNGISIGDSCDRRLIINIRERHGVTFESPFSGREGGDPGSSLLLVLLIVASRIEGISLPPTPPLIRPDLGLWQRTRE